MDVQGRFPLNVNEECFHFEIIRFLCPVISKEAAVAIVIWRKLMMRGTKGYGSSVGFGAASRKNTFHQKNLYLNLIYCLYLRGMQCSYPLQYPEVMKNGECSNGSYT